MLSIFIVIIVIGSQFRNSLSQEFPEFDYPITDSIEITSSDFATDFMPVFEAGLDEVSTNTNEPNDYPDYDSDECRFTEICERNKVIYVNNTIKLGPNLVVFFYYDHQTVPYLISGIRHGSPENLEFDALTMNFYDKWNQMNGSTLTQLNDFIAVLSYHTFENDLHAIFIVKDPNITLEYLLGYDVKYTKDYENIISISEFYVDPNRYDKTHDQMLINKLYRNFPSDMQSKAKPIVFFALPDTGREPPNRVFVFIEETNPNNTSRPKFMVYILKQIRVDNEYDWVYDENSGESKLIYGHKIDAAVIISSHIIHNKIKDEYIDKFYELEFYSNGEYGVRSVEIRGTSDKRGVTAASFDASNVKIKVPIRNLFKCHICTSLTTTTIQSISTSIDDEMNITNEATEESKSGKKSKKVWLWVLGFIVLVLISVAIGVAIFCCIRRRSAAKEDSEDMEAKDEQPSEFERKPSEWEAPNDQTSDERLVDDN